MSFHKVSTLFYIIALICVSLPINHKMQASSLDLIESNEEVVYRSGDWSQQNSVNASGGSYVYGGSKKDDTLVLPFYGSYVEIIYISGVGLGTLALEIDGIVVRTVITTDSSSSFDQRAVVNYLDDGPHVLKVYAQIGSVVAIDGFYTKLYSPEIEAAIAQNQAMQGRTDFVPRFCDPARDAHFISLTYAGSIPAQESLQPSISTDGRFVAFVSYSDAVVPGDTNNRPDVFVRDRWTCTVTRVSVDFQGNQGTGNSTDPSISADGRFVAFTSTSSLASTDAAFLDVYRRDREANTTIHISVSGVNGAGGNGDSVFPSVSAAGNMIAFESNATNLVSPTDGNGVKDIFVRDLRNLGSPVTRIITRLGNANSSNAAISGDGNKVVYESDATTLIVNDNNHYKDIFVSPTLLNPSAKLISMATNFYGGFAGQGDGDSRFPSISYDGRYVAFESDADNLSFYDSHGGTDIFIHDSEYQIERTLCLSWGGNGHSSQPVISNDGKIVSFYSESSSWIGSDVPNTPDAFVVNIASLTDPSLNFFERYSNDSNGSAVGGVNESVISSSGKFLAFASSSPGIDRRRNDTNNVQDVFAIERYFSGERLALFGPNQGNLTLVTSLNAGPTDFEYQSVTITAPASGQWVMGDWDGDGDKTVGVYGNGAFFYINDLNRPANQWQGAWIGLPGVPVAGRFSSANNDCIGVIHQAVINSLTVSALYFTCQLNGNVQPPITYQWLSTGGLPDGTFSGAYQWVAGDWDGNGSDTIAVRRGMYISYTNISPTELPSNNAAFDHAQYWGTPAYTTSNGIFVAGKWSNNENGIDSFGVYYPEPYDDLFYYRQNTEWNLGPTFLQLVKPPNGNVTEVASWKERH